MVLLFAASVMACQVAAPTVAAPPTAGVNRNYPGRRAPLLPEPLLQLPIGAVDRDGLREATWLGSMLDQEIDGMVGHLPELSHWCRPEGNAWRSKDGSGESGWEELPYWLQGFVPLAYLERDRRPEAWALAVEWLEAILASQREDGYFGPESNRAGPDLWPNMPILWAMRSWFEATGDRRIVAFLTRYFRYELALPIEKLLPDSWQKVRGGDNLDVVYWLYDRLGEPWLLELAKRLHEQTVDWTAGVANWHGVNFCQGFREPAQFFAQSGERRHLDATYRNYAEMMAKFGQVPGGMFGADENSRPGHADPRQAAEACSMVEFMRSFEKLGAQTGDLAWFDRCEEVAFNSLPAAMDRELRSLHYLTAPNLVACDEADHGGGFDNGGCMLAFSPDERYRCCQHNVAQGWPGFMQNLWFATRDGGLAAAMHSPCRVRAKVGATDRNPGEGIGVTIYVDGSYPFLTASEVLVVPSVPVRFPLYLRVPGWCDEASVSVDDEPATKLAAAGRFVRIEREWKGLNRVKLVLPTQVRVRRFPANGNCAAVDRGPLTYSLELEETWKRVGAVASVATNQPWTTSEVTTAKPWNFGLVLDPADPAASFKVEEGSRGATYITCGTVLSDLIVVSPITAQARQVPAWQLDGSGLVAPLQPSPVRSDQPTVTVRLIPMGFARLRIAAFPVIGDGPDAVEWKLPPPLARASHRHDSIEAVNDGLLPKDSCDHAVPRFTFWDHLGSVEWLELDSPRFREIDTAAVYWFDDAPIGGRCRVPKAWRLLWQDDDGTWREVEKPSGYGVAKDALNRVTFTPMLAKSFRLEVTSQPEFSSGLFEWTLGDPPEK